MNTLIDLSRLFRVDLIGCYFFRAPASPAVSERRDSPATLILMQAGLYKVRFEGRDKPETLQARAGDVVYWPAGFNRIEENARDNPARCVVCQFLWQNPPHDLPRLVHDHDHLVDRLGNRLLSLHGEQALLPPEAANGYLAAMLAEFIRIAGASMPPLVSWVARFTEEHLTEPFLLSDLARDLGLHPCHLVRQYRKITGLTPMEYVRRRRADQAAGMLLNDPARTLASIAPRVGVHDERQLRRLLKRYTGMTAREIRRRRTGRPAPSSNISFRP